MSSIDPNHGQKQAGLRTLGGVLVAVGGILTLIGLGSFFSAFGSNPLLGGGGAPDNFWCAFLGLPLLGIGANLLRAGYLGAATRYVAGEVAPVVKDTIAYLKDDGAETASATPLPVCPQCQETNPADAEFCSNCGASLRRTRRCQACGEENAPDARFCHHCGRAME